MRTMLAIPLQNFNYQPNPLRILGLLLLTFNFNHVSVAGQDNCCDCAPYNATLELVFVVDCSSQRILDEFERIVNLVDQLNADYPNSRFGIVYFADWPNYIWAGGKKANPSLGFHTDQEGCYKRHLPLTTNPSEVRRQSSNIPIMISGMEESAVAAMTFATADPKLLWSNDVDMREGGISRMLVLITNQKTLDRVVPDIPKRRFPPRFDGKDTCYNNRNPTNQEAGSLLTRKGVSVFAIIFDQEVEKQELMTHWQQVGRELKIGFELIWGMGGNPEIYEELRKFIGKISMANDDVQSLN